MFKVACLATAITMVACDPYEMPVAQQEDAYPGRFGTLVLPHLDYGNLPPECDAPPPGSCEAEASGDFHKAFTMYESRLMKCGWKGFDRRRMTGEGVVAAVFLLSSPCGLNFTGKFGHKNGEAHPHVVRNCDFLARLAPRVEDSDCRGCFPKFYHYSNYTGVCYAELIHAMPMTAFLDHINAMQHDAVLPTVKLALHQGLSSLKIIQSERIRHQDLSFRNVMVRIRPQGDPAPFRVVIFDFGSSYTHGMAQHAQARNGMGNHGYPDAHAWACAFYSYFYDPGLGHRTGCRKIARDPSQFPVNSLKRFLVEMMREERRNYDVVDYFKWQQRVRRVESL
jgi:hypothetical protein